MAQNSMAPLSAAHQPATGTPAWIRQIDGFTQSSSFRQLLILVALAATLSFMVGFFLWGQKPSLVPLYTNLGPKESAAVVEALRAAKKNYQLSADGAILVDPAQLPAVRMLLAGEGLPSGNGVGLEMLDKDQSLGTSQFVEQARYQHAIEIELARSIETIQGVSAARVHLATPKQSVFVREQQKPTASVVVELSPGQSLTADQVRAIVHLVASSVAGMKPENVSVIDQRGELLSQNSDDASGMGLTDKQFAYRQRVERAYARQIEALLTPIVGANQVRAQVSADIDFSRQEGTSETYGPKTGVVLSEQTNDTTRALGDQGINGGVPGALSNQPPGGGTVTPQTSGGLQPPANLDVQQYQQIIQTPISTQKNETRNYNVDKDIRHTQYASGAVDKLNVAVLLDEKTVTDKDGKTKTEPMSDAELARIKDLVSQAVGLDEQRGDKLTLASIPFVEQKIEKVSVPLWQQEWFMPLLKNLGLGVAMLLIFLMVVRPLLKMLADKSRPEALPHQPGAALPNGTEDNGMNEEGVSFTRQASEGGQIPGPDDEDNLEGVPQLVGAASYADKLRQLKQSINHDPKAVAAVIKQWTHSEN
ncbi:flagellar basal-body MS-ring/collar protein FliF [Halothiobacillus neapolitanus]|uniref:Flagellar M-ring protein n=1 Tax=Halothiobacillus neapolitanus (strain ATCC 23641 / DSM 15147 / CIP 104769 / NCIMB 8539 / c2) TaxID=555778 RepID=D0KXW7_HALNC|nr:flagellar basal-body MS-ring/collar protein FliF [Halothiobacillus neapolitanus]ACX95290.1 flagellar M-ring protein FliF [Halothiobacillus neapolitanus c2]TDN59395.1 flagellar M-ring protein FliF [Halothiobacillus neapolitanus]